MNLNKVILIGRLTRDPEKKALPSGQSLTSFGMATNRYYTGKDGQRQEQTDFHNIVIFGKLAETASQYLAKGSLTLIEGRIQTRSWQDKNGNKAYRTEIIGERMQMGPRSANKVGGNPDPQNLSDEIPVIEENEDIDVKDIPF